MKEFGLSPSDVFVSDLDGTFSLYASHESLGLGDSYNLDALDIESSGVVTGKTAGFGPGRAMGYLEMGTEESSRVVVEPSGIAKSEQVYVDEQMDEYSVFWAHNDRDCNTGTQSCQPITFASLALNESSDAEEYEDAELLATFTIAGSEIDEVDAEAMDLVNGTMYIADIGTSSDNEEWAGGNRSEINVHEFPEPDPETGGEVLATKHVLTYPAVYLNGGDLPDAQTFFVDPITGDFYIITVDDSDVFWVPRFVLDAVAAGTPVEMMLTGSLSFTGAVAGDVSLDGREVVIKSEEDNQQDMNSPCCVIAACHISHAEGANCENRLFCSALAA